MIQLFRTFFGYQDPSTMPPPRKKCPNYKVHSTFKWARYIWRKAWITAKNFSADKQITMCQGTLEYITRYGRRRRIGDGLLADCITDNGYTFDFYFRNEPVDPKWIHRVVSAKLCV